MVGASDQAKGAGPGVQRKDVLAAQAAPDRSQLQSAVQVGLSGEPGGVDGAHRGTDHQIGPDAGLHQRVEHPDLDSAEAAASRQHKSRLGLGLSRLPAHRDS